MKKFVLIFILIISVPALVFGQNEASEPSYEQKYEWRIRQETLYGVYIPKDVNEAIVQLNKLTDEPSKAKFKAMTEEEGAEKLFFSLGRWMSYNWSFYDGSRFSVYMQGLGIHHPDDMSRFLIIVFHRSLNKKPLEIKALLQQFHEKEEQEKQERLKNGTILFEEKRKVTSPPPSRNGQR